MGKSKPHNITLTEKVLTVAEFVKLAAEEFSARSRWLDMTRLHDSMDSDSESLVNQINEDLDWLCVKLKKMQNYEQTTQLAKFEKKLIRQVNDLNHYAARFSAAIEHFNALTWELSEFNVEEDARAIRLAKRELKLLEKSARSVGRSRR